jgi:hypothetical protein
MTHDELLAKIETAEINFRNVIKQYDALRSVVELHKPIETTPPWISDKYIACSSCEEYTNDGTYNSAYPCPTIQAIEKKLN